jgi:hypothetical protein
MKMNTDLYSACISLYVNHIPDENFFFKDSFVDGRIKAQLFGPFHGFKAHDDMRDSLAITAERVFGFGRCELCHFAFIDLLGLFYSQTCRWGLNNA